MNLTQGQAENKVENEKRMGYTMTCRAATAEEINPPQWIEEECDD
jgi:hypothetical protein